MLEQLILGQVTAGLPGVPGEGGFFSLAKILVMLVAVFLWAMPAGWCSRDARRLSLNHLMWGTMILSCAMLGWLFWLFVPIFAVGLMFNLLLGFGAVIAYAIYRDTLVEDDDKILKPANLVKAVKGEKEEVLEVVEKVRLANSKGQEPEVPATDEGQKIYQAFQNLMFDALWRRAGEVFIQPAGDVAHVRFKIDGVVNQYESWDRVWAQTVIDYAKSICGMDAEERRKPQKGKLIAQQAHVDRKVTLDIQTAGSRAGEKMIINIRAEESHFTMNDIGFSKSQLEEIQKLVDAKQGLIIIAGMGGSGVTSTSYSIGRTMDAFIQNIHSVEVKPLMELDNITQNVYVPGSDQSFTRYLQSISRREPDVILVDPCHDPETAKLISTLVAGKKKKIFATMRASNSLSATGRLMRWIENNDEMADVLLSVMFQRLVRKLCPVCKEAYHPNPETLRKMNLSRKGNVTFYRPPTQQQVDKKGNPIVCPTCQGTGYLGRTAVFELLTVDDKLREAIRSGNGKEIKSAARRSGLKYWDECALEKVLEGVTSVQEIVRVGKEAEIARNKK